MIQGTPEWIAARLGKATASRMGDLMAKTKTGWGASRKNYAAELVIERLTGEPAPHYQSADMINGSETEPEARAAYSFVIGCDIEECGFIAHPNISMAGASPDGIVRNGTDQIGLVEIKCPKTATHIETLLDPGTIDQRYLYQMQWQMACTMADWCDFVSYDRRLPEPMRISIARVERDHKLIVELEAAVRVFLAEVDGTVRALRQRYLREAA